MQVYWIYSGHTHTHFSFLLTLESIVWKKGNSITSIYEYLLIFTWQTDLNYSLHKSYSVVSSLSSLEDNSFRLTCKYKRFDTDINYYRLLPFQYHCPFSGSQGSSALWQSPGRAPWYSSSWQCRCWHQGRWEPGGHRTLLRGWRLCSCEGQH